MLGRVAARSRGGSEKLRSRKYNHTTPACRHLLCKAPDPRARLAGLRRAQRSRERSASAEFPIDTRLGALPLEKWYQRACRRGRSSQRRAQCPLQMGECAGSWAAAVPPPPPRVPVGLGDALAMVAELRRDGPDSRASARAVERLPTTRKVLLLTRLPLARLPGPASSRVLYLVTWHVGGSTAEYLPQTLCDIDQFWS